VATHSALTLRAYCGHAMAIKKWAKATGRTIVAAAQRTHELEMAREERTHQELTRAYEEFMVHVVRTVTALDRARRTSKWEIEVPSDEELRSAPWPPVFVHS
jgi:hypothetical protein